MNPKQPRPTSPGKRVAWLTALALLAGVAVLCALYVVSEYLPLLLMALCVAMPLAVFALLFLPAAKPTTQADAADDLALLSRRARLRARVRGLSSKLRRACARHHVAMLIGAIVAVLVGVSVLFWWRLGAGQSYYKLGYHIPVILVAFFVVFVILDNWCRHATPTAEQDAHTRALLHNFRSLLALCKLAAVVTAVACVLRLLSIFDAGTLVRVLYAILFAYETVFLLLSLVVRVIRRELTAAPDLAIPMPGIEGSDLGLISYLEKNTGITMRSLWSIRLIKTVLPYAAIATLLVVWGVSGVVKVDSHQRGAHYRLGVLQEQTLEPGLHFTLPWPFDSVEIYDTATVRQMTVGYLADSPEDNLWTQDHGAEEYRLLLGGGEELVSINLRIAYRIDDLNAYLKNSAAPEAILQALAYEEVTARTIGTDLSTLLATDRTQFAVGIREVLNERAKEKGLGLSVVSVVLESIHPPVDIAGIYQELVGAGIKAEEIILAAEGEAELAIIAAENNKVYLYNEALAAQYRDKAAATATVAEFVASVEADENYRFSYRYQKYLDALASAYGDAKIVLVGEGVDTSNIFIGSIGSN